MGTCAQWSYIRDVDIFIACGYKKDTFNGEIKCQIFLDPNSESREKT